MLSQVGLNKNDMMVQKRPKINYSDLKRIGLLGCGGFGAVTLEEHKKTGKTYALKTISKGYILRMRMQDGVKREKQILFKCNSDFIVRIYATFNLEDYLCFLLEPAMGGELFQTYHKYKFHGHIPKARFYSACVVMAFEHLHKLDVIYRDLKPENLLLDDAGYCKLTDMGLAKEMKGKPFTWTTCGTPDYFAPEICRREGYSKNVDWWTLGILIHELL